mmetsp:Transcript_49046/g.76536  ORF Transcript_49046/g.76536 Transcript_49046/m.76536 type:complete len:214 (-) Transcript_49046:66-707(-)
MGAAQGSRPEERTSLVKGLGASIHDSMRPSRQDIESHWREFDANGTSFLDREQVHGVLLSLVDYQVQQAAAQASKTKTDMAKQQAELEKMAREARSKIIGNNATQDFSKEDLDRAMALHMGSTTGPVMAGMMSGYVDIPVTALTSMKEYEGKELLVKWEDYLFRTCGKERGGYPNGKTGLVVNQEDFITQYLEFFDSAPKALSEPESSGCVLQ